MSWCAALGSKRKSNFSGFGASCALTRSPGAYERSQWSSRSWKHEPAERGDHEQSHDEGDLQPPWPRHTRWSNWT
jgi:hypothetical protein